MSRGLLGYKLAMSAHMHFEFFVDNTLLNMRLTVMRSAVGVVTSPGKLIKFPPKVSGYDVFQPFAVLFRPQFSHRLLLYLLVLCPWE